MRGFEVEELKDLDQRWENLKIVDNFLPQGSFNELQRLIVDNHSFPLYVETKVSSDVESINDTSAWSWYGCHVLYHNDEIRSTWYSHIMKYFIEYTNLTTGGKFLSNDPDLNLLIKAMMRVKVNFYPHTDKVREHKTHADYPFKHKAAIFSLNTCDGFTRLHDGTKVDSVANRMMFFDASYEHNSSTTSTCFGRYNINFNFL